MIDNELTELDKGQVETKDVGRFLAWRPIIVLPSSRKPRKSSTSSELLTVINT